MQTGKQDRRKLRVGVIFGGRSAEHDVSLRSAETVIAALNTAGHDVVPIGVTRSGQWLTDGNPMLELQATSPLFSISEGKTSEKGVVIDSVEELSIAAIRSKSSTVPTSSWSGDLDVIFPVLHGPMGEDGTVQGLFELAGVPYVGGGVLASSLAMDKAVSKQIFAYQGIPQVNWLALLRKDWETCADSVAQRVVTEIGFPCFVKPANMGSSVGVSKVNAVEELAVAIQEAGQHDRKLIVEASVNARELEVAVIGNDEPVASVVGEVIPGHEFYDYEAKYVDDSSELQIPAEIPDETADEVRRIAVNAFTAVDCAGLARVDFFLCRDTGAVLLNEINTLPGFTSISMYPLLWEASGVPHAELVNRLIELAIERHDERNS